MTTPKSRSKGGAPPGNRNALKHALYAKYYPEETKKTLLNWDVKDHIGEAHLLRAGMDKLAEALLMQKDVPDAEKVAMLNAIARASSSFSLLVSRYSHLNPIEDPVYIAWDDITHEREFFNDGEPPE
jgi:hypothetical protein